MMYREQIGRYFVGLLFSIAVTAEAFAQSSTVAERREDCTLDDKASSLITVEWVARAEQRVEALRTRLLEIQMNELEVQGRIEELDYQLRPDRIQQALAFVGSPRPMDELRGELQKRLEYEKARVTRQLELLASNRKRLEATISSVEREIERARQQLDLP